MEGICDYCGDEYDPDSEGHCHYEDGSCECVYCRKSDALFGLSFCDISCENNYVSEHQIEKAGD